MAERNLYLTALSPEEASEKYGRMLEAQGYFTETCERISSYDAAGRITYQSVYANCCSPLYNSAAMDGIAVTASETEDAREEKPLLLEKGHYLQVDTGDPVTAPFDAVIMAEDINELEDGSVEIYASAPVWQHVRPIGEDIAAGEMVLPKGHRVRAVDIGALLASGHPELDVVKRKCVGILPTGTEIVPSGTSTKTGDIIDSNTGMVAGLVREAGALSKRYGIIPDDKALLRKRIAEALGENDLVVVIAGSSAGREDYTAGVLAEMGEVAVHGVSVKPGKPVILAVVGGKPVIGLPGYPVSAYLAFRMFVEPLISSRETGEEKVEAVLSKRIVSSLKYREFVRMRAGTVDGRFIASPMQRGAGALMSLVRADGYCIIPQKSEGFEAGDTVELHLLKPRSEIEKTLISVGSHDMIMDEIGEILSRKFPGFSLSSAHVGSMAGLLALKRGETTIAPTHLLDEKTGVYNIAVLKELFPEGGVVLVKGVERIQGIMVKKGNPLGITGVESLVGKRYVNRQKGAGTRVLLDYLLKEKGISPRQLIGYEREAATHMAVAAAVAGGDVDAGMGIRAAADAMGLDFIEVRPEEYDFALREKDLQDPKVKAFLAVLNDGEFLIRLDEMGGYSCPKTGTVIRI